MINLLLAVAVQAASPTKAAVNAIIDPPTVAARRCVIIESVKLDDGQSDAGSVADGAMSVCGKDLSALRNAVSRMIDLVWGDELTEQQKWDRRDKHMAGITDTMRRLSTRIVLEHRQANR